MHTAADISVDTDDEARPAQRVLVVDDSAAQRKLMQIFLRRWGYDVAEADSAESAICMLDAEEYDAIISDWMMPGMSGLELCRLIRDQDDRPYTYFILLTSKSEKLEVAQGLDVGADDFLSKPVSPDELLARVRAGERILRMERELREKNRQIGESLQKIATLYDSLDSDLADARNLQHSLVKDRSRTFGSTEVSLLLRASGHVGGDLVGCFQVGDDSIGIFSIDVSGHGVASALLTARLAGLLSSTDPDQNIALTRTDDGTVRMLPPHEAASRLNTIYFEDIRAEQYFTMILAEIDLGTGSGRLVMCGHPHPIIQSANGETSVICGSGMPLGLFEDGEWEDTHFTIPQNGRLFLTSDGITECETPDGRMLEEEGLALLLTKNASLQGQDLLEALLWDLNDHAGDLDFTDDVSGVLVERGRFGGS